jgi:hypothetical protein
MGYPDSQAFIVPDEYRQGPSLAEFPSRQNHSVPADTPPIPNTMAGIANPFASRPAEKMTIIRPLYK